MSKELRDIIESIDSTNKAHSDLTTMINYLKEEVQRLNHRIVKQKRIISSQGEKVNEFENSEVPEDLKVLKEMIIMQREELSKKDEDIKLLENNIEELTKELENQIQKDENEALIQANRVIAELTQQNEEQLLEIEDLKLSISELKNRLEHLKDVNKADTHQDLIDAKKLLFQLTEESGIKQVKIESLKAELQDLKKNNENSQYLLEQNKSELESARNIIATLTSELESSREKVEFLKQKLKNTIQAYKEEIARVSEDYTTHTELNEQINNFQDEISSLNHQLMAKNEEFNRQVRETEDLIAIISDLKTKMNQDQLTHESDLSSKINQIRNLEENLILIENQNKDLNEQIRRFQEEETVQKYPMQQQDSTTINNNSIPNHLFLNMMNLMTEEGREIVFNKLVKALDEENRELRTNSIKLMGLLANDQSFDKLKGLVYDSDWVIKLYLIKALEKFRKPEIIDLLNELQSDSDPDVRETAEKALIKMKKIIHNF
jgi:chromosome segregation ATPase